MPLRRLLPLLLGLVALAIPVAALPAVAGAQGAGDNQYQDPFGDSGPGSSGGGGGGGNGSGSSGGGGGGGASSGSGTSTGTSTGTGTTTGTGTSTGTGTTTGTFSGRPQLARTGADPLLVALAGLGLLLAGVGLRLRLREHTTD